MNVKRAYFFYVLIAAMIGLLFGIWTVFFKKEKPLAYIENPYLHYLNYKEYVYGTGTVIPVGDEIDIRPAIKERVSDVYVKTGDIIKKGDPLFHLNDLDLLADLHAKESALNRALTQFEKLSQVPRSEDLKVQEAAYNQANTNFKESERQFTIAKDLFAKKAISEGELKEKTYRYELDKAKLDYAEAQLNQTKAGTWGIDLRLAKADIDYQKALVDLAKEKVQETMVRSPIDGRVLKVNTHIGEIASSTDEKPAVIIGNDECYAQISIDENEIPRFQQGINAIGFFRGENAQPMDLIYVKTDPLLTSKTNIKVSSDEKVDVRVLKAYYNFKDPKHCQYVGQQIDVFIPQKGSGK